MVMFARTITISTRRASAVTFRPYLWFTLAVGLLLSLLTLPQRGHQVEQLPQALHRQSLPLRLGAAVSPGLRHGDLPRSRPACQHSYPATPGGEQHCDTLPRQRVERMRDRHTIRMIIDTCGSMVHASC